MKRSSITTESWRARVVGVVHLAILLIIAIAGARYAASNYYVRAAQASGSLEESQLAVELQVENPSAHDVHATALLRTNDLPGAANEFENALGLSPNDYRLWLHLSEIRARTGDREAALETCLRAVELAPNYSRLNMQAGKLYLEAGQPNRAFEFFSRVVRNDQFYFAEVLNYANFAFEKDPDAIWRAIDPTSKKAKSIVAWYFLDHLWMSEQARAFLLSDELTSAEKNTVIRFLLEKKSFVLARQLWQPKTQGRESGERNAAIFDGGFEMISENDQSGLGWQIENVRNATITRDQSNPHSGQSALNIRFAGNVDLRSPLISQIAFVEPGQTYTLTFFIRSGELLSASLPVVLIMDPGTQQLLARSAPIEASNQSWVQRSVNFTAPDGSAILISLQRPECSMNPCPIYGDFSIDDVAITPDGR